MDHQCDQVDPPCNAIAQKPEQIEQRLVVWPRLSYASSSAWRLPERRRRTPSSIRRAAAERALRQGEYEMAEKLFRELLARDANDKNAHLGLSFSLLKQRNLRGAFDHAARAVTIDPSSARAHALVGTVVLASGDFQTAVEEFSRSAELQPDEAMASRGSPWSFLREPFFDSFAGLTRAVYLDSNDPITFSTSRKRRPGSNASRSRQTLTNAFCVSPSIRMRSAVNAFAA